MMNIRQRSVNVSRQELLQKLRENLEQHRAEYQEALSEFKARLESDLQLALKKVKKADDVLSLKKFSFDITFPQNHENDYIEVIEMLEMSVDETINLDAESFRAYIKNDWAWNHSFKSTLTSYKLAGSSLTL